ncbi:MAG: hypothetical protein ACRDTC_23885 [Pseudonocardiaceae bacterium]
MAQRVEYWFACSDVAGRAAKGAVLVRDGELVMVLPEPGSASFGDLGQVREFSSVLAAGIEELHAQRNVWGGQPTQRLELLDSGGEQSGPAPVTGGVG